MNKWMLWGSLLIAAPAFAQDVDPADASARAATDATLELVSFTAESAGAEGVRLHWSTLSERANVFFVVQRSSNGMTWETALGTPATGRNGHTTYTIVDPHPFEDVSYYRLLSLEGGESTELSDVFAVDHHRASALLIQNGTVPGRFVVTADGRLTDVKLLNDRGQFIPLPLDVQPGLVRVNAEQLAPGTYYVQAVVDGNPVLRSVLFTGSAVIGG
ncbi:MAG: hypothetical protein QM724_03080 [Flavobacteriales bacterium]